MGNGTGQLLPFRLIASRLGCCDCSEADIHGQVSQKNTKWNFLVSSLSERQLLADCGHDKLYQDRQRHSHSTMENPLRNSKSRGVLLGLASCRFPELRSKNLPNLLIFIIFPADSQSVGRRFDSAHQHQNRSGLQRCKPLYFRNSGFAPQCPL